MSEKVIDQAIKTLFEKYSQEKDKDKFNPTQVFFGCKVNHGITPPEKCLSKTSKRMNLDRFQKLQRIFSLFQLLEMEMLILCGISYEFFDIITRFSD